MKLVQRIKYLAPESVRSRIRSVLNVKSNVFANMFKDQNDGQKETNEILFTEEDKYEHLYETQAKQDTADTAIGDGDYDLIGKMEADLLMMEGLLSNYTLLDFGCGNGRLAVKIIPVLTNGKYIGIDISDTFIERAKEKISKLNNVKCNYKLLKNATYSFPIESNSIDMICAFSVFTHMEHEDCYKYLLEANRIIKPGGLFILSCLPITLAASKQIFIDEADYDLKSRWKKVRNIITSVELMSEISTLAGWNVVRWYAGDQPNIKSFDSSDMRGLGQSSCVLRSAK